MLRGGEGGSIGVVWLVSSTRPRPDLVRALLSLLRCLDVPSVPLIAILDSAMDLGGGGATGRHGGGEGSSGNREDVFELRLGLQRCEIEAYVIVEQICKRPFFSSFYVLMKELSAFS